MSFFEDASLVLIPSGIKNAKVYSVKPTDGTGDLTFSRASSATRVQSDGLIEKVRENLILQSNTFSNASWTKTDSIVTGGQSGYDGTTNAWLLSKSAAAGRVSQSVNTSGLKTFSLYAKAGTNNWVAITFTQAESFSYFDLLNGTLGGSVGTDIVARTITSVGNGWYRISISVNNTSTSVNIYVADSNGSVAATSGNILIQAAQIEASDIATDYIATTTAAVSVGPVSGLPRLDYLGSTCPRLLLEPQRTNLVQYSEQINNAGWLNAGGTTTANTAVSPTGYQDADTLTGARYQSTFGSNTYTLSAFAKKVDGDGTFVLRVDVPANKAAVFNLNNGTIVSTDTGYTSTITSYGNGWYRCTLTTPASTTISNAVIVSANAGVSSTFLYGAQLEVGAYATSYIPTLGASVTRVAEGPVNLGTAQTLNNFTLFYEGSLLEDNNNMLFGSGNSAWYLDLTFARVVIDLASGRKYQAPLTFTANTSFKFLAKRTAGVFEAFVNGVKLTPTTQVTDTLALSLSSIGWGFSSTYYPKMKISQVLAFQTALSDTQCIELTA
jgi:hypothetical protein